MSKKSDSIERSWTSSTMMCCKTREIQTLALREEVEVLTVISSNAVPFPPPGMDPPSSMRSAIPFVTKASLYKLAKLSVVLIVHLLHKRGPTVFFEMQLSSLME